MYTIANPEQFWNAKSPILVTESGMVIDVNQVQLSKALSLILLSDEVGVNSTDVNNVHS